MKNPRYFRFSPFYLLLIVATLISIFTPIVGLNKPFSPFFVESVGTINAGSPEYSRTFVCHPCNGPAVHSATIVSKTDGGLMATWFGGSREGAGDVRIYTSTKSSTEKGWSIERPLLDRKAEGKALGRYLKKLGNPVLGRDKDGRLWLFYVSVSAGGWSGSAINYKVSKNNGQTWSRSKRLITSPFFNVSTLVRGVPLARMDGSLSLPVYHELVGKFSEMLQIDASGRVTSLQRISHGKQSFQPAVAAMSEQNAILIARSASKSNRHIFISHTQNAGRTWSKPVATSLPNPDAGISITVGPDHSLLVVYNDSQTDRGNLALAISHDTGKSWKRIFYFEKEKTPHSGEEYSYPTIIRQGNEYHLVYTWHRTGIRYIRFNNAWVRQQEQRK